LARANHLPYQKLIYREGSSRQVGSSKKERIIQASDIYHPMNSSAVKGKNILLVDDVLTTGATLSAVAKALKSAGAKNVYGLVFGKKM
jgi:predicted amidophosphoribosyltransferase